MVGVLAAALFYGLIGVAALMRPRNLLASFGIEASQADSRMRSARSMAASRSRLRACCYSALRGPVIRMASCSRWRSLRRAWRWGGSCPC